MAMGTAKTVRPHSIRIRVSDEELDWLREESEREDRPISAVLRLALRDYYQRSKAAA